MSKKHDVAFVCDELNIQNKNGKIQSIVTEPVQNKDFVRAVFANLDLLVKNKDIIYSHSEFYNIQIPGFFVGGIFIGQRNLLLGDLMVLWENTNWHSDDKYYYSIVGSPLSGRNSAKWYNSKTKQFEGGPLEPIAKRGWGELGFPAFNYKQHGSFTVKDKRIVCPGWSAEPVVSKLTLFDLLDKLNPKQY